jgi:YidC/Oxa1 family membrane protein insertase
MHYIFDTFFYAPLYNGLVWFINIMPWHSVALAVILFTCIIKIILFPLSQKSVKTQFEMKRIEPEINEIKTKYKDDKKAQAEKTMRLYKERGINPFSGVLLMIIQFPVLIALYYVFLNGGLPNIDHTAIYSFTKIPDVINMNFLGISVGDKSVIFALLAAVAQFFQMQITVPKTPKKDKFKDEKGPSFKDELAKSMGMQMKYVMPVIIFFIAKSFPVVVSLYLITSSLFAIGQELYVRKQSRIKTGQIIAVK